jgi:UDP-2,4-diacetamido-2,4,6-trideoxy-beta-L-altropyranose hydrolase
MPLVIFRADASAALGAGHVMRCLALVSTFLANGWSVGFAATADTFATVPSLTAMNEHLVLPAPAEQELAALASRWPGGADILVVDHYRRGAVFERACRSWARRIVVIDDLADRSHDADVLVDSSTRTADSYSQLVPTHCRVLVGSAFALIRPEFERERAAALARRDGRPVGGILVSFGLTDDQNATALALTALGLAGFDGAIHVVLGSAAPNLAAIRQKIGCNATLHVEPPDMAVFMRDADLAIGASGATAWERCCLGLPSIILITAKNQRGIAETIAEAGAGINLGPIEGITAGQLAAHVRSFVADAARRRQIAQSAGCLIDAQGAQRIFSAMNA